MKTLMYTEVDALIKAETGFSGVSEDRVYEVKPLSWYLQTPLFGVEKLYYAEDVSDCDDFCDILKVYWLRKHWKKGLGPVEGSHWPAIPVFRCKVKLFDAEQPHWIMMVICSEGIKYIERTEGSIIQIPKGRIIEFLKVN